MKTTTDIKSLIKTKWAEQFDILQLAQIEVGLAKGLDVTIYAKPEYEWDQMAQIRFGLEDGLDVTTYAKPELTWKQMVKIRRELEKN